MIELMRRHQATPNSSVTERSPPISSTSSSNAVHINDLNTSPANIDEILKLPVSAQMTPASMTVNSILDHEIAIQMASCDALPNALINNNNNDAPAPRHHRASRTLDCSHNVLETSLKEDFEWDEHYIGEADNSPLYSPPSDPPRDDPPRRDGMASLRLIGKETGYLGVASGAAMLQLFEDATTSDEPCANSGDKMRSQHRTNLLATQLDMNRHIADSMIDAYFRTYHLSYPILHEPTFRAQYAEILPQPHGRCWPVLAYTVAAIGVFATSTDAYSDLDLRLFTHARALLSFDLLEVGNLTLVQALTLVSNYQQKRDKPNSGYNYLGLAVRMATGLGLHKEFPGWNISQLRMEIRRRVWWSLCVFDVGATITFSRPMVFPYEGVEVAFPLNVADRVGFLCTLLAYLEAILMVLF